MKKTTSTLLSMALVFSSFGALSAHAESLQKEKQFSPQLKTTIEQWGEHKIAQNVETKTTKEISVIVELHMHLSLLKVIFSMLQIYKIVMLSLIMLS
ncbi:hypothetical protein ABB10_12925 [Bacillus thuringiensis]|uniref:Uncharacterized protein n=1 Tax=Bacillus thuringiensis DB27 TaxID=1431339 RepID=W8YHF2_BACTU|nr:hypothetical protein [Bacillus thuringiensis]MBG9664425.1 hypothetical protein [Bacillus thuringiensis]MBH0353047.1 hypothetical protein [Bacillus thuringiensis]CDN37866.1 unnamed protein product [Bacillus thuringiensis DB27]